MDDIFSGLQSDEYELDSTRLTLRFVDSLYCNHKNKVIQMVEEPAKETTAVAFVFKEGIIMAAHSSSKSKKEIIEINTHMFGVLTGFTSDYQTWHKYLRYRCRWFELENERRISLTRASSLLRQIMFSYLHCIGSLVDMMIAGWDEKGPGLYCMHSDVGLFKGDRFAIGSGCRDANVVLDIGYRYDMTVEEAVELAQRSIYHATFARIASVYYVGPDGCKKLSCDDVAVLHYENMVAKDIKGTGSAKVQRVPFNIPGLYIELNPPPLTLDLIEKEFISDLGVLNRIKEFRIEALQAVLEEMYAPASSTENITDMPNKAGHMTSTQKKIMEKVGIQLSALEEEISDDSGYNPISIAKNWARWIPALARDVIEQQTCEEIEELHQRKAIRKAEFEETYALSHAENDAEAAHVKILSLGSSVNVELSQTVAEHRGGGCRDWC